MPSILNYPINSSYTKGVDNPAFPTGETPFYIFAVFQDIILQPDFVGLYPDPPNTIFKMSQITAEEWKYEDADFICYLFKPFYGSTLRLYTTDFNYYFSRYYPNNKQTEFIAHKEPIPGYIGDKGIGKIGYYIPPQYANIDLLIDGRPTTRGNNFIGTTADYFQITTNKNDNSKLRFTRNE